MGTIEDVKAQLDIVETVRGYVPALKRVGRSWKAPCPFHSEKTPSFIVDPDRGTWHCFGACSTGGDVIGFVQRIEHLDFRDALQRCAERAGVELRPPSPRERQEREVHERLLRANEAAAVFFQAALMGPAGTAALAYAEQRGLDQAARDIWQIGYAPDEWRALTEHLLARGFTEADLREAGLAIDGDRGLYDRFRDRLIYPTRDARGRMIGFGARALAPDQEPKYLNTPQTPLFDKSGSLYGLDRAGEEARRADRMVVVEGYMDVIACHQAGIRNVVASMGTSITEKQMLLLKRYTQNILLILDADNAGQAAAERAQEVVRSTSDQRTSFIPDGRGVAVEALLVGSVFVGVLPEGEDPDSLVRSDAERFRQIVDKPQTVEDYLFAKAIGGLDLSDPQQRSRAVQALAPFLGAIGDDIIRSHYIQRLARIAGVQEAVISAAITQAAHRRPTPIPSRVEMKRAEHAPMGGKASAPPDGEAQLLQLLLLRDEARTAGLALDPDVFEDTANRRLFEAWREVEDLDAHLLDLDDDLGELVSALRASALGAWDPSAIEAKHVAARVEEIARLLRLRRARARLVPAALAQATAVAEARRSAAPAAEIDELNTELAAMDARQRMLARGASQDVTSYDENAVPASPSGGGNGVEGPDDPDV